MSTAIAPVTKSRHTGLMGLALAGHAAASSESAPAKDSLNSKIPGSATTGTDEFEIAQLNHLVLTQYYRWYQVYEVPFTAQTIENHKDILDKDVEIISVAGTSRGTADIAERLKVFEGWQNAHHVKNVEVKRLGDGAVSLEADIMYQNIRPDNSRYTYTLHYSTRLRERAGDLPVFTSLKLTPTGTITPPEFDDAYPTNRTKSLMHRWLYLIEAAKRSNHDQFRELLAPSFKLYFSGSHEIDTWEKLEKWLAEATSQTEKSTHSYRNFSVKAETAERFLVSVDFDWKAINTKGQRMIAETHHEWIVTNVRDERFARIQEMRVTATKPLQIVE